MLLILWMFHKKMDFSISKEQSFRINIKNAGFNVIKSLKLNQDGGILGLVWWGFFVTSVQESKQVLCQGEICIPRSRKLHKAHLRRGVSPSWQTAVQPCVSSVAAASGAGCLLQFLQQSGYGSGRIPAVWSWSGRVSCIRLTMYRPDPTM